MTSDVAVLVIGSLVTAVLGLVLTRIESARFDAKYPPRDSTPAE